MPPETVPPTQPGEARDTAAANPCAGHKHSPTLGSTVCGECGRFVPDGERGTSYERVQWEVWADGEDLRHGLDSVEEAARYANKLSDEWKTVEIVTVRRTVTRVR